MFRIILFVSLVIFSSCQVGRYVVYNFAGIKDYKIFPSRPLEASEKPFQFHLSDPFDLGTFTSDGKQMTFEQIQEDNKSVAFLIIRNDTLLYENYFNKYEQEDIIPSFSMAKSFTSLLVGCAIEDGYIKSVKEPVSHYLPELKKSGFDAVKISHLLNMTAGIDIDESYINPFGHAAAIYYGRKLRKQVFDYELKRTPGTRFDYTSGTTQLLGVILERALKDSCSLTSYFNSKIWLPLDMEYDASWSIDRKKNGLEKTFCCVNARARDYAKIGRLMLKDGNWNGQQVIPKKWVNASTQIDTSEGSVLYYQYQWWILGEQEFMAQGILGQYIYINKAKNVVMVRLGKKRGKGVNWWSFFSKLSARL